MLAPAAHPRRSHCRSRLRCHGYRRGRRRPLAAYRHPGRPARARRLRGRAAPAV